MGLLGNLIDKFTESKTVQNIFKPGGFVDKITTPIQAVGVITSNPITAITKGYGAAKEKVLSQSADESVLKIGLNTAAVATAVVGGGAAAGSKAAINILKPVVPIASNLGKSILSSAAKNPIKAAVGGLVVAPAVLGVVKENPDKAIEIVANAPSNAYNFGSNVGEFLKEPSLEKAKEIVEENPYLSAAAAGAGLFTLGKTILPAAGLKSLFDKDTPPTPEKAPETNLPTTNTNDKIKIVEVPSTTTTAPTIPVTPQTQNLSSSTGRVKRRKRKAVRSTLPSINQRVNVIVQQNKTSRTIKNYINREVLLN